MAKGITDQVWWLSDLNWRHKVVHKHIYLCKVKVKFSHTRYWVLGPELFPVYWQSARRWLEVIHLAVFCHYLSARRQPSVTFPKYGLPTTWLSQRIRCFPKEHVQWLPNHKFRRKFDTVLVRTTTKNRGQNAPKHGISNEFFLGGRGYSPSPDPSFCGEEYSLSTLHPLPHQAVWVRTCVSQNSSQIYATDYRSLCAVQCHYLLASAQQLIMWRPRHLVPAILYSDVEILTSAIYNKVLCSSINSALFCHSEV